MEIPLEQRGAVEGGCFIMKLLTLGVAALPLCPLA